MIPHGLRKTPLIQRVLGPEASLRASASRVSRRAARFVVLWVVMFMFFWRGVGGGLGDMFGGLGGLLVVWLFLGSV